MTCKKHHITNCFYCEPRPPEGKPSALPWKFGHITGRLDSIVDANDNIVFWNDGVQFEADDIANATRIINAVNLHTKLVAALEDALATFEGIGRGSDEQRNRYRTILAEAKGERR